MLCQSSVIKIMPNLMLKTASVLTKKCVPIVVSRSMRRILIKPTCHSQFDAPRVLVNYALSRYFHINIDLNETKENNISNEKQPSESKCIDSPSTEELFQRHSGDNRDINSLSQEELDNIFPSETSRKEFKLLLLELDVLKQNGLDTPQVLTVEGVHKLLTAPSRGSKMKVLRYLYLNELKEQKDQERKTRLKERYQEYIDNLNSTTTSGLKYGMSHNSLFLRLYNKTLHYYDQKRLVEALQFSPILLLDCGYEDYMNQLEVENCVRQIVLSYATNRESVDPYNLQICNLKENSQQWEKLRRSLPNMCDEDFPVVISEKSYLDLYDTKDLVYLTPHCRKPLLKYNPNKIYIIGAFVDKHHPINRSSAKAKREGLEMARLPLDEYVQWGPGSGKSLAINTMMSIMLTIKNTKNWQAALEHVPRRKLQKCEQRNKYNSVSGKRQRLYRDDA